MDLTSSSTNKTSRPPGLSPRHSTGRRSNPGSLSSRSEKAADEKESLNHALAQIHSSASRSHQLTSFEEFGPPPPRPDSGDAKMLSGDLMSAGIATFYNKLRASVGGAPKDAMSQLREAEYKGDTEATSLDLRSQTGPSNIYSPADGNQSYERSPELRRRSAALPSPRGTTPILMSPTSVFSDAELQSVKSSSSRKSQGKGDGQQQSMVPSKVAEQSSSATQPPDRNAKHPRSFKADKSGMDDDKFMGSVVASEKVKNAVTGNNQKTAPTGAQKRPPSTNKSEGRVQETNLSKRRLPSRQLGSLQGQSETSTRASSPNQTDVGIRSETEYREERFQHRPPSSQQYDTHQRQSSPNRSSFPDRSRKQLLAKEYWMKDENARDCFYCGDVFSTFRRKHHCRKCGHIFDSKCTVLISGQFFGQYSRLRVCKPCEAAIQGQDEDSSSLSSDDEQSIRHTSHSTNQPNTFVGDLKNLKTQAQIGIPLLGVLASRKEVDVDGKSPIVEFDNHGALSRPTSSRSLRAAGGIVHSPGHARHKSRQQYNHTINSTNSARIPFHRHLPGENRPNALLPAFQSDNIVDPDFVPFLSDEGSSGDDQRSISSNVSRRHQHSQVRSGMATGFGSSFGASERWKRPKSGDQLSLLATTALRDSEVKYLSPTSARRRLSSSSLHNQKLSPKRSKSNNLINASINSLLEKASPPSQKLGNTIHPAIKRSSSLRGLGAPPVEMSKASLEHVRRLLRQLLVDAKIPSTNRWIKALIPILLQCVDTVDPDVFNGDDIDIRHYLKLKRITGGDPMDTSLVYGIVFTKNLASKAMLASIHRPKIIVLTFPVEYARPEQHFMSLQPVIAQEREYIRNLVNRIVALGPDLLLSHHGVTGLALGFLEEAKISVVHHVKLSVLAAVARCTQTQIISSVDGLSMDPQELGTCGGFDVKTYAHKNTKKTYVYISGCQADLGCTIALRGASLSTLTKLKHITEFMSYIMYSLKLETCLMRDEFVQSICPSENLDQLPATKNELSADHQNATEKGASREIIEPTTGNASHAMKGEKTQRPEEINEHSKSGISNLSLADENSVHQQLAEPSLQSTGDVPTFYSDMAEKHRTKILSGSPCVRLTQPHLLMRAREQELRIGRLQMLRDRYASNDAASEKSTASKKFELVKPEMICDISRYPPKQVREYLHAVHEAEYNLALHNYNTQKRQWEGFISGGPDPFNPFSHQNIAVLYSLVNTDRSTPCVGPDVLAIEFYQEHEYGIGYSSDCTLGHYVEDLCYSATAMCGVNGCQKRLMQHHRQYVHSTGQLSIFSQVQPPRIRDCENVILMWSSCKICEQETQVARMSDNTWKYSFGKYLELAFWSTKLHPRASTCTHDIRRDHLKFFSFKNILVRLQYDTIDLYEVVVPRPLITWKVAKDLKLKNEVFVKVEGLINRFMVSVKSRIECISLEAIEPEKLDACILEIEKLTKRAHTEHEHLIRRLQEKYMGSKYFEVLPFNRVLKALQEKAISWDEMFADFERDFYPSEKDIRKLAALQLRRMFLEREEQSSSIETGDDTNASSQTGSGFKIDTPGGSDQHMAQLPSNITAEKAHDAMVSVVDEHCGRDNVIDDKPAAYVESPQNYSITSKSSESSPVEARQDHSEEQNLSSSSKPNVESNDLVSSRSQKADQPLKICTSLEEKNQTPSSVTQSIESSAEGIGMGDAVRCSTDSSTKDNPSVSKIPRPAAKSQQALITGTSLTDRPESLAGTISQRPQPTERTYSMGTASRDGESTVSHSSKSSFGHRSSFRQSVKVVERKVTETVDTLRAVRHTSHSLIPRSIHGKKLETRVSALAKHFEQISREFEKERLRQRNQRFAGRYQARAKPLALSRPTVQVFRDAQEAVQKKELELDDVHTVEGPNESEGQGKVSAEEKVADAAAETSDVQSAGNERIGIAYADLSEGQEAGEAEELETSESHDPTTEAADSDASTPTEDRKDSLDTELTLSQTESGSDLSIELPKHEKVSLMKMLASFWSERSASGWTVLDYPFGPLEHCWQDSDIVLREDEPSSLIAVALSHPDYLNELEVKLAGRHVSSNTSQATNEKVAEEPEMHSSNEAGPMESALVGEKASHISCLVSQGTMKAQCKIMYAESFELIRRKCGVAERFAESLSRCLKWDSKGGKTKSLFLKTLDDRFVLKSLSRAEVDAFNPFAPNYFAFMSQTLFRGLPSVIAKMLGLFQVVIKNPVTGVDFNWYMLVMENLFYDRDTTRRFDLKGSMRNRKVESTGELDEVLLDENLVDMIYEKPIFVREHSFRLLQSSVWNDTLFLSKQNVMDYSLMAGFDETRREIVVGIIDSIRTYTWDKKLESWIKDRGKNKPTITNPKDYRHRFRVSISNYILLAPNCWHHFHARQSHRRITKGAIDQADVESESEKDVMPSSSLA